MSERPIASWEREGDVSFDNDGPGAGIRDGTVTERPQLAPNSRPQRSQKTFTPHEYKQAIFAHSQRSIVSSSFPGRNYAALANWLIRPMPGSLSTGLQTQSMDEHRLIVLHHLGNSEPGRLRSFTDQDDVALPASRPLQGKGHLLFLRGFLSSPWVAELGSRYRIDPEFFNRHLDFFDASSHGDCFNTPSLLNTTNNIIHVPLTTLFTDSMPHSTVNLYDSSVGYRGMIRDQLSKYKRSLQKLANCGDSIVREYSILSKRYSVIEQRISICIVEDGDGWAGILWMDNGRDLDKSPLGPWNKGLDRKSGIKVTSLPVIQHHPKMTWRKLGDGGASSNPPLYPLAHLGLPQSISTLPLEYQSLLSALDLSKRAEFDPLHALIPVFAHSAFSEVSFLNLIHELLGKLTEPIPLDDFQNETFETLQHLEIILERHVTQIRHCIRSIQLLGEKSQFVSLQSTFGSRKSQSPQRSPFVADGKDFTTFHGHQQQLTSFSAAGIYQDHEDLLERCLHLLSRVNSAKTSEMNRAMILESRRAIEQSDRTKKLTLLATYYIPLTFTATLFGMNFSLFGQSALSIWWYVVLAVPFTLLTHVLYSWNLQTLYVGYRSLVNLWKSSK